MATSLCIPVVGVTSPRGFKGWVFSQGPLGPRQFAWLPIAALVGFLLFSSKKSESAETAALPVAFPAGVQFAANEPQTVEGAARESAASFEIPDEVLAAAIERATPAFVFVAGGSGVCISPDGFILTNYHVIDRRKRWPVRINGNPVTFEADVVGIDPLGDVALLKISGASNLPYARLADLNHARVGEAVLSVGDPYKLGDLDGAPSVSLGTLSALHRYPGQAPTGARTFYADSIQTDAAVNPGNSGGPLMNLNGEVLGLTGQIMARFGGKANSRVAYAVPARQLERFLPLLKNASGASVYHGTVPLGLEIDLNVSDPESNSGLPERWPAAWPLGTRVASVRENVPAYKDGFRAGDRILSIECEPVLGPHRALSMLQSYPESSVVRVDVARKSSNGWERVEVKTRLPKLELNKS